MAFYGFQHHPSAQEESPTQAEIAERAALVRAGWTVAEEKRRRGVLCHNDGSPVEEFYVIPTIKAPSFFRHEVPSEDSANHSRGGRPRMQTASKPKFTRTMQAMNKRDRLVRDLTAKLRSRFPDARAVPEVIDAMAKLLVESDEAHFAFEDLRDRS